MDELVTAVDRLLRVAVPHGVGHHGGVQQGQAARQTLHAGEDAGRGAGQHGEPEVRVGQVAAGLEEELVGEGLELLLGGCRQQTRHLALAPVQGKPPVRQEDVPACREV